MGPATVSTRPSLTISGAVEMLCVGWGACPGAWPALAYVPGTPLGTAMGGIDRDGCSWRCAMCGGSAYKQERQGCEWEC